MCVCLGVPTHVCVSYYRHTVYGGGMLLEDYWHAAGSQCCFFLCECVFQTVDPVGGRAPRANYEL